MGIEDIEVVAYLLVEKRFGHEFNRLFFAEGIEKSHLQPEIGDTALYTTEQMQEYAIIFAAFALKEGEPTDLVFDEDYKEHAEELFKEYEEAQDEEV